MFHSLSLVRWLWGQQRPWCFWCQFWQQLVWFKQLWRQLVWRIKHTCFWIQHAKHNKLWGVSCCSACCPSAFRRSSALLHSCLTEQLCCFSAHSFDVISQRSFPLHQSELHKGSAMLQVWTAAEPARHLRCITTATATESAAAQPVWCITAASATEPATVWSLWCCAVATAATLQHHTACSRSCTGFSGDRSNQPRL